MKDEQPLLSVKLSIRKQHKDKVEGVLSVVGPSGVLPFGFSVVGENVIVTYGKEKEQHVFQSADLLTNLVGFATHTYCDKARELTNKASSQIMDDAHEKLADLEEQNKLFFV